MSQLVEGSVAFGPVLERIQVKEKLSSFEYRSNR